MKSKILRSGFYLLALLAFVLGTSMVASATSFSDLVVWNAYSGWVWGDEPFSYVHQLPQGTITSATLSISGELMDSGTILNLTGTWDVGNQTWSWSRVDMGIMSFWNHQILDVTVQPGNLQGTATQVPFHLLSSELSGQVNQGSTEIPEPTSLLLLGAGLVGMAGYRRYRAKKKRS